MESKTKKAINKQKKVNNRWKTWYKAVAVVASIVVFITTYFLILPAITMTVYDDYWVRVTDTSELTTDGVYLISSGNYAMGVQDSTVVSGNAGFTKIGTYDGKDYYDVSSSLDIEEFEWKFGNNGSSGVIGSIFNEKANRYIGNDSSRSYQVQSSTNSTWKIYYRSGYYNNTYNYIIYNNGSFNSSTTNSNNDLYIYKLTKIPREVPDEPTGNVKEYWVEATSASDITTNDEYIILDSSSTHALGDVTSYSGSAILTQKGTKDDKPYYELTGDAVDDAYHWTFGTNGTGGTARNVDTSRYVYISYNAADVLSNSSRAIGLTYNNNYWQLKRNDGSYYLSYNNNQFSMVQTTGNATNLKIYKKILVEESTGPQPTIETYWIRVTNTSDLTAGDTYIIRDWDGSAHTNFLTLNSSNNPANANATLTENGTLDGVTKYTATGIADNYEWILSGNGSGTLKNVAKNRYLRLQRTSLSSDTTNSTNYTFTWNTSANEYNGGYWYISTPITYYYTRDYYLSFDQNSQWSYTNGTSYRAVEIFKKVIVVIEPEDLEVPDKESWDTESSNDIGAKSGNTSLGSAKGKYYSDPTSSRIENLFPGIEADNGKIMSDKSVSYGSDNFGVFDSYDPNTFGVTLSALAQDYNLVAEATIKAPLDVVFVIDTSSSMLYWPYYATTNSRYTSDHADNRARTMVTALNQAMAAINALDPNNRIGVAFFDAKGTQFLPLDHYSSSDNQYVRISNVFQNNNATATYSNTSTLRRNGQTHTASYTSATGTYTQGGLNVGANMFLSEEDTTANVSTRFEYGDGTVEDISFEVKRTPVFILLTDGVPTYYSTNWQSPPTTHPNSGGGNGRESGENSGLAGYYIMRTARNYKNQIEEHYFGNDYQETGVYGTKFYTIAAATFNSTDQQKFITALLNPTTENLNNLETTATDSYGYNLMQNLNNDSNFTADNTYYSYADGSQVGTFSADELASAFEGYVSSQQSTEVYGIILKSPTGVRVHDPIGEGMEIKSVPILSYGGLNYKPSSKKTVDNVITYYYNGSYTNPHTGAVIEFASDDPREQIKAEIETDENGLQTVTLIVPDDKMPSYSPDISTPIESREYFEAEPVRLTYKVGLTDEAQAEILELPEGESLVYYTNRWDDDVYAYSNFLPTIKNPYYTNIVDTLSTNKKDPTSGDNDNRTNTNVYNWQWNKNNGEKYHILGNNGKLVFSNKLTNINVTKVWSGVTPNTPITVSLYSSVNNVVSPLLDGNGNPYTLELSSANDWQGHFVNIRNAEANETYYLVEEKPDGYIASYTNGEEIWIDGVKTKAAKIVIDDNNISNITVTNTAGTELPSTGGPGTLWIYVIGTTILTISVLSILDQKKKKIKKVAK